MSDYFDEAEDLADEWAEDCEAGEDIARLHIWRYDATTSVRPWILTFVKTDGCATDEPMDFPTWDEAASVAFHLIGTGRF